MSRIAHSDIRKKILDAAEHRLWHYGFKKTTIDEIAADAGVGKGTVYLYFESKEDIALAIVTHFKLASLDEMRKIALETDAEPLDKLKLLLSHPLIMAYQRCLQSPAAQEIVLAVRPQIQERLWPYQEQEISLIATVIQDGNKQGIFSVADPLLTAKTLKTMCAGFRPPYPLVESAEAIEAEISHIVDLVFCGLCHPNEKARLCPSKQITSVNDLPA